MDAVADLDDRPLPVPAAAFTALAVRESRKTEVAFQFRV